MSKIDWSKPIEVYSTRSGDNFAVDAEVIATGLKAPHPYVVLWNLHGTDRVDVSTEGGVLYAWSWWGVRNKPVVHRKYVSLSVTKAGGLVIESFETKEDADHRQAYRMGTGKYVVCDVVELEWTEE